jgi:hypothetical protein
MLVLAAIVSFVVIVPPLLEPRIFRPPASITAPVTLWISMNSSLAPAGPRVRNSLITSSGKAGVGVGNGLGVTVGLGDGVTIGVGDGLTIGEGLGDSLGDGVGDGVELGTGVGVGIGVGVVVGMGVGVAVGVGEGSNVGVGFTVGLADGDGVAVGEGLGPGAGSLAEFCGSLGVSKRKSVKLSFVSCGLPAAPSSLRS